MKIKTILFSSAVLASLTAQPLFADEPVYINGKWFHNHEVNDGGDLNLPPLTPDELAELLAKSKNMALKPHPTDVINLDVNSDGFIDEDAVFDGKLEQRLYELLLRKCASDPDCLNSLPKNLPGQPGTGTPAEGTINIGDGDFQSFFLAYWKLFYEDEFSYKNGWKDFMDTVHNDWHAYQAVLKERELENTSDSELIAQITGHHHHTYSPEFVSQKWQEFNGYWENLSWWDYWYHYFNGFKDYKKGKEKLEKFLAKGYSHDHQYDHYDPTDAHHLAEHAEDLKELRTVEYHTHPWQSHAWKNFFDKSFKFPTRVVTWNEDWNNSVDYGDADIWNKWHVAKMTGSPMPDVEDRDDQGKGSKGDNGWHNGHYDDKRHDDWDKKDHHKHHGHDHARDDDDDDHHDGRKGNNGWHNGHYDDKRHDDWDKKDHKHHDHDRDDDDDDHHDGRKGNNGWHNGHYDDKRNDGWDGKDKKGKWGDVWTDEDDAKQSKKGKNKKDDD